MPALKKVLSIFLVLFTLFSCKDPEEEITADVVKPRTVSENFGFNLNDFNVVHDTISRGDTFGSIMESQNLDTLRVYDIVQKIKDDFDVRSIRSGKPFTLLREKGRYAKLQAFIYQPDRQSYYVVDLRDSVSV